MKLKKRIVQISLVIFLLICNSAIFAQALTVIGKLTDRTGSSVMGGDFSVKGKHTASTPSAYGSCTLIDFKEFTAGNTFVFINNGSYDINFKLNAEGKLVYAGLPNCAGTNINAPGTGSYTVILNMSAGDGSYTYKVQ